jgi:hypothetical protein
MYPFKLMQLNSITNTILLLSFIFLFSCARDKNETNLNKEDLATISTIIPLDKNETIELFETNGGFNGLKTSGNLITNKRIASYWLDGNNDEIHTIEYKDIDSIHTKDHSKALTYASYLQIYSSSKSNFKVYVDADSSRTWRFFNKAIENWKLHKNL